MSGNIVILTKSRRQRVDLERTRKTKNATQYTTKLLKQENRKILQGMLVVTRYHNESPLLSTPKWPKAVDCTLCSCRRSHQRKLRSAKVYMAQLKENPLLLLLTSVVSPNIRSTSFSSLLMPLRYPVRHIIQNVAGF